MSRTYLLDANVFIYLRRAGRLGLLRVFARLAETHLATTAHVLIEVEKDPGWTEIQLTLAHTPIATFDFGLESLEGQAYETRRVRRQAVGKNRGEDSCLAVVECRPDTVLVTHDEGGASKAREFGPDRGTDIYGLMIRCADEGLLESEVVRDVARDLEAVSCLAPPSLWLRLGPP